MILIDVAIVVNKEIDLKVVPAIPVSSGRRNLRAV
jgi:hypothetical protein